MTPNGKQKKFVGNNNGMESGKKCERKRLRIWMEAKSSGIVVVIMGNMLDMHTMYKHTDVLATMWSEYV